MRFFVLWLSAVIKLFLLLSFLAANTLPALLEQAALIDSTSLLLICEGFGLLMTFTNSSFKALLGTGLFLGANGYSKAGRVGQG
jgi:hypothetical protein